MAISEEEKERIKNLDTTKYVSKGSTSVKTETRVLRAGLTDAKLQEHYDHLYGKDLSPDERLRLGIKRNMEVLEQHVEEQERVKRLAEQKEARSAKKPQHTSPEPEKSSSADDKYEMNFGDLVGGLAPKDEEE